MLMRDHTQEQEALHLLRVNGPMRSKAFTHAGIHNQTLARMVQSGKIKRVRWGLYQLPPQPWA